MSHFSLQCLQSVLAQESLHTLLRCRENVGFWHPATWLSSAWIFLCLPSFTFMLLYVSHSRNFDSQILHWSYMGGFSAVINCSLFRLLVQLPYGNCCQLKVCASVHETTSAHNFPYSSDPGDASGNLFSTVKGYLWIFHSHQQNTWYKLNPTFVISVIAAAWVLCWISSFLLLPAHLSLWNANTVMD